jgi:hypothetical protein
MQGNDMVKAGPKYYRDALVCYTQALDQKSSIAANNSVYYSNRAAVQLMLRTGPPLLKTHSHLLLLPPFPLISYYFCSTGNYSAVVVDCMSAIECNHGNIKAYVRYAKWFPFMVAFGQLFAGNSLLWLLVLSSMRCVAAVRPRRAMH